jgi:hypothetical protein
MGKIACGHMDLYDVRWRCSGTQFTALPFSILRYLREGSLEGGRKIPKALLFRGEGVLLG